ncbi:MAG TPA: hypothetical protein VFU36_04210 [Jatrophihabitans sp.]|nr:hypothetical protein [Jatrophihabitans sp.]
MTDTTKRVPTTDGAAASSAVGTGTSYVPQPPQTSAAWTGWVMFAAIMMAVVGAFSIIEGITAIFRDSFYVVNHDGLLVRLDYSQWGWVHLILGVLLLAAGIALPRGPMWARIVAVALAAFSAIINLAFITAYPVWSIIVIAVDIIVIFAVTVHGREVLT